VSASGDAVEELTQLLDACPTPSTTAGCQPYMLWKW
jgi:hypothetical protein